MAPPATTSGQTQNASNPFSKKRRFEDISNSSAAAEKEPPKSNNTSYFDARSQIDVSQYHSALGDDSLEQ